MQGPFLSSADFEKLRSIPMYTAFYHLYTLRLAVLYDAPIEEQQKVMDRGMDLVHVFDGLLVGAEWSFLSSMVRIRTGSPRSALTVEYSILERCARCQL